MSQHYNKSLRRSEIMMSTNILWTKRFCGQNLFCLTIYLLSLWCYSKHTILCGYASLLIYLGCLHWNYMQSFCGGSENLFGFALITHWKEIWTDTHILGHQPQRCTHTVWFPQAFVTLWVEVTCCDKHLIELNRSELNRATISGFKKRKAVSHGLVFDALRTATLAQFDVSSFLLPPWLSHIGVRLLRGGGWGGGIQGPVSLPPS